MIVSFVAAIALGYTLPSVFTIPINVTAPANEAPEHVDTTVGVYGGKVNVVVFVVKAIVVVLLGTYVICQ